MTTTNETETKEFTYGLVNSGMWEAEDAAEECGVSILSSTTPDKGGDHLVFECDFPVLGNAVHKLRMDIEGNWTVGENPAGTYSSAKEALRNFIRISRVVAKVESARHVDPGVEIRDLIESAAAATEIFSEDELEEAAIEAANKDQVEMEDIDTLEKDVEEELEVSSPVNSTPVTPAPSVEELVSLVAPETGPADPPVIPTPPSTIVTSGANWYDRLEDHYFEIDKAIAFTKELADNSTSRDLDLDDFELVFDNGNVEVHPRRNHLGPKFKWTLNHWSFGQLCTLVSAPAGFLRGIPGSLAVECLNVKIRQRNRSVSIYRTNAKVNGIDGDTVRAFTSKRYKRYEDHRLLTWVKDSGLEVLSVATSDRGVEAVVKGQKASTPDHDYCDLVLLVGNSEVGASSLSTTVALQRRSLWRIPITMAGARVRHIGDVDKKALDKLDAAKMAFENADTTNLQDTLENRGVKETRSSGEWYGWLKRRGVGRHRAKEILPPEDSDGNIIVSRWDLAVKLAKKAAEIPYFDDRLREELIAAKVLGV